MADNDIALGSRWKTPSGAIYIVIAKHPFGKLEVQREGTWRFGFATIKEVRSSWKAA